MVPNVFLGTKSVTAIVSLLRRIPTWIGLIRTNLCKCLIGANGGIACTDGLRQTTTFVMLCQLHPVDLFLRNFISVDILTQIIMQTVSILCSSLNNVYVSPLFSALTPTIAFSVTFVPVLVPPSQPYTAMYVLAALFLSIKCLTLTRRELFQRQCLCQTALSGMVSRQE